MTPTPSQSSWQNATQVHTPVLEETQVEQGATPDFKGDQVPTQSSPLERKRRISLRLLLVVPVVLQIFGAVGLVGYLSYRNGQQAVNDLAGQLENEVSSRIEQNLLDYVETPHLINQVNADAIRAGWLNVQDPVAVGRHFWKQIQLFDSIGYIQFGSEQREFVGLERLADGSLRLDLSNESTGFNYRTYATDAQGNSANLLNESGSHDPRVRPWYTASVEAGEPTWSEIYPYFASPKLAITAVQPYYGANGQLVGVLGNDLTLSQLNQFLQEIEVGKSGLAFIVERSGDIVASSTEEEPFRVSNEGEEVLRLPAVESEVPLIRASATYLNETFGELAKVESETQSSFEVNGDRHFLQVTPFKDERGLDWLIVVVLPQSDFTAQIDANTRTTVLLSLAALGVAIAVSLATSRWIMRPIEELNQASRAIAQGDLDQVVQVKGVDELSKLGHSFNQMTAQLRNSFSTLEETNQALEETNQALEARVVQRTVELQQARETADQAKELSEQTKEELQQRALQLLQEVDPIRHGDLTVRARVTADEIGTVADSYNATVESLQKIVAQVQAAATQVDQATRDNEASVQNLSEEALRQSAEISTALDRIEEMSEVVQAVAISAEQAEAAAQQAAQTVDEGDAAMNRTVDGIQAIRATVAETAKKVKHLGESSQRISAVVELIGSFAAQTNMLALNASIEASRAGEEGRGFAVVAAEVRVLARQSAEATEEIRKLVASIQAETNEVVATMESGTEQVVSGTRLVDETRQSLNKITAATAQISRQVKAIAQAATMQTEASKTVTQTMQGVVLIANRTSEEAAQVAASFEQLRQVAQDLQIEVSQFRVS
ncbi:HAMP domain-containing protein [Oculatella sp. FACHB-28]|uniref:methyl-accepting chemotaxis protein n=1 Tax=Oculatella sp. FACHB-28 TaxID=2692845 RepID=UPI0016864538|nr:methyl-accepting chemotaxis protein [Oculatella sp. FACHB-28]MBD2055895.1 HAMP domain-containing protein [Oculatella sp. FACHB-28]